MLYHSLEYFIATPVIRLGLSLLFPLGILSISDFFIQSSDFLPKEKKSYLFLYLTILFGFCSCIYIHGAVTSNTPIELIRYSAYTICLTPFIWLWINRQKFSLRRPFSFKIDHYLIFSCLFLYLLISLAPATDADSLGYHLAIPLSVLQGIELYSIAIWNHQYLIGIGDYINLIGLTIGTDCLGAVTQFVALLLFLNLFYEKKDKLLYLKAALAPFLLIFLLSSQKNQLFGAISICLAFIYFVSGSKSLKPIILIFIACAVKLSFYISGGILFLFYFFLSKNRTRYFLNSLFAYTFFLFPIHCFNYITYQTPIPPFLKFLIKDNETKNIMHFFQQSLQNYTEGLPLPLGLFLPSSLGTITTTFGPSCLVIALLLFFTKFNKEKILLIIMTLISAFLAQKSPRFFLCHYFLAIWILYNSKDEIKERVISYSNFILTAQLIVLLTCLTYGATQLFPGALSAKLRESVLSRNAFMHPQISWANKQLPSDALLINSFRTNTTVNRPFITQDFFYYQDYAPKLLLKHIEEKITPLKLNEWYIILTGPLDSTNRLHPFISKEPIASKEFQVHTRNPFSSQKGSHQYYIYIIDKEKFLASLKNSLNPIN